MTALLAMPLASVSILTGTNEDWVDSILYTVDDGGGDPSSFPQLDLTGIEFEMELRSQPPFNEVVLRASTANGTLAIGEPPNFGYLLIQIGHETMKMIRAGLYTGDIVGRDDVNVRRCIVVNLELAQGITRP